MRKRHKLYAVVLFLVVLLNINISTVNATTAESSSFKDNLGKFLERDITDEDVHNWSLMISSLQADGLSTNAIAGILGNVKHEGASGDYAIEGYGGKKTNEGVNYRQFELGKAYNYGDTKPSVYTKSNGTTIGGEGHGLVQWSFGRADNLTKFAEENPEFGYVTVTHWKKTYNTHFNQHTCKIPSVAGQVCFMVQELNKSYKSCKEHINEASSASSAAKIFHDEYEKSVGTTISARQKSAEEAVSVIKSCTGVIGSTQSDADKEQSMVDTLVSNGVWTETQFASFCNLTETELVYPDADSLDENKFKGIRDWKDNVQYKKENAIIRFMRKTVVIFGILLIIWTIFLYLSYWFDRVNNFVEISLLEKVSFGKLLIAPDEDEATFDPRGKKNGEIQTVNHRHMIGICLTSIFFAVLIISGKIYDLLGYLIRFIMKHLGI